jgi:hypothetical protein
MSAPSPGRPVGERPSEVEIAGWALGFAQITASRLGRHHHHTDLQLRCRTGGVLVLCLSRRKQGFESPRERQG